LPFSVIPVGTGNRLACASKIHPSTGNPELQHCASVVMPWAHPIFFVAGQIANDRKRNGELVI
jgi:hypothetical protein